MESFSLKNGLKIQLYPNNNMNTVMIELIISGGLISEDKNNNGITHLLEHMIFEGTKKYPSRELFNDYMESIGFEFSASTCREYLNFSAHFPAEKLIIMLEVLKEMIFEPALLKQSLDKEKQIVLDEIDQDNCSTYAKYRRVIYKNNIYKNCFIGLPILGSKKNIKAITIDDLKAWYKKIFYPANMSLCILGNIKEFDQLKISIAQIMDTTHLNNELPQWLKIPPTKLIQSNYQVLFLSHTNPKEKIIDFEFNTQSYLSSAEDKMKLDIVSKILGFYLFKELRQKLNLTYGYDFDIDYYQHLQTWHLSFVGNYNKIQKIIFNLIKLLNNLKQSNIPADLFENIKEQVLFYFYDKFESREDMALYSAKNMLFQDFITLDQIKLLISGISQDECQKLFMQIFNLNNYNFIFYANLSADQKNGLRTYIKKLVIDC